jgi:hypothetical protein
MSQAKVLILIGSGGEQSRFQLIVDSTCNWNEYQELLEG